MQEHEDFAFLYIEVMWKKSSRCEPVQEFYGVLHFYLYVLAIHIFEWCQDMAVISNDILLAVDFCHIDSITFLCMLCLGLNYSLKCLGSLTEC